MSLLAELLSGGFSEQTPLQTLFTKDYAKLIKTSPAQSGRDNFTGPLDGTTESGEKGVQ